MLQNGVLCLILAFALLIGGIINTIYSTIFYDFPDERECILSDRSPFCYYYYYCHYYDHDYYNNNYDRDANDDSDLCDKIHSVRNGLTLNAVSSWSSQF